MAETTGGITGTLTDGTGVSKLLASKVIKDLVLDFIITAGAGLVAINVGGVQAALVAPVAVGTALLDAAVRVAVRALIRWAQSPSVA